MKKLLHIIFVAMMVAACSQDVIVEVQNPIADLTRTINVSFEGEDTRIQLNDELKTVWTKDDLVSVFYRSTVNEQWQFQGETGDRSGDIMPVDSSINPPATTNHIVVVYPYNEGYFYNSETRNVQASLPAEQTYLKDSYGLNGNIMISSSEYNQISLKSVCGWLKLQLTGSGEKVKSIALRGNNDEQVAGELYINSSDASSTLASTSNDEVAGGEAGGTLVRPGTILKEVTLNCGDGVELGTEPTAFYIALPPQTFATGLTIDIECDGYTPYSISTDKAIIIERNTIQPMAAVEFEGEILCPNNQLWYTTTDDCYFDIDKTCASRFGANTIISNIYENGKGIITFDTDITSIGEEVFNSRIKSIEFPASVVGIHSFAFANTSIEDIDLKNVSYIGSAAFYGCSLLKNINIPDNTSVSEYQLFYGCKSLENVTFGDNTISAVDQNTFYGCNALKTVTFGTGLTEIKFGSFENKTNLTEVTFAGEVGFIGSNAFIYCYNLDRINNLNSVGGFGANAFYSCGLSEFEIPVGPTSIPEACFYGCNFKNITIPASVKSIGAQAFSNCSLESITIPATVTNIYSYAFANCSNVKSITIESSETQFTTNSFSSSNNLEVINTPYSSSDKRCLIKDNELYLFAPAGLTEYTLPSYIKTIKSSVFSNNKLLENITIPNSVTTIEDSAFQSCTALKSITLPSSITTIGDYAFAYCENLKTVYSKATTPPTINTWYGYTNSVFYYIDYDTWTYIYPTIYVPQASYNTYKTSESWEQYADYIIGYDYTNNVEAKPANNEIWYYTSDNSTIEIYNATGFNANIVSNSYKNGKGIIKFDADINIIGYGAFQYEWTSFEMILPESIEKIDSYAFGSCSITSIRLPEGLTEICYAAFQYSDIAKITLPESLTKIGDIAFKDCTKLLTINIPESINEISSDAFLGCDNLRKFSGKFASSDGRCLINNGTLIGFAPYNLTSYTLPSEVTAIGSHAFQESTLSNLTIPESVTSIGSYAFYNSDIANITIPESITQIGSYAFSGCDNLTSVKIPSSLKYISDHLFFNCKNLKEINIHDQITSIGQWAFNSCSSLSQITIPDSVETISSAVFEDCTSLSSVTIGRNVKSIGNFAFSDCSALSSVTIKSDNLSEIGYWVFQGCKNLKQIIIPASVNTIGICAFQGCGLTSITLPRSVNKIESDAFYNCSNLSNIYCESTAIVEGGYRMFQNNASSRKIYVPIELLETYKTTSYWSEYSNSLIGFVTATPPNDEIWYTTTNNSTISVSNDIDFGASIVSNTYENGKGIIKFNKSVTKIGGSYDYAFTDSSLRSITFPNSVTSFGHGALQYNYGLFTLTIPENVTSIAGWSFQGCTNIRTVYCESATPPTASFTGYSEWGAFATQATGRIIYVPKGSAEAYKNASGWKELADYIKEYDI